MSKAPVALERRMFPAKEAAHYLGISVRSLAYLAAAGQVPKTKLAGRVLYDRADLDAYVERVKRSA